MTIPAGFIQIKEYQMWGNCATFKNYETGEVLFQSYRDGISLVNWDTMKNDLRDLWRPAAREEQDWFCNHLSLSTQEAV